ncbi:MAG: hypothetical protein Q8P18_21925 [Pseudomonadota bacterium]|nr:hypothetical protein [Pseudomonadota bacterium]
MDNTATLDGGGVWVAPNYTWNQGYVVWEGGLLAGNHAGDGP